MAALSQSHRGTAARPIKRVAKAPAPASSSERQWAQQTLKTLSLHDVVAQLIVSPFYGEDPHPRRPAYHEFARLVRDVHIGGFIIINRSVHGTLQQAQPYAMASFLNRMQRLAKVPLLVGGDFERGSSMRMAGTVKYPHNMAFAATGNPAFTRDEGAATAREARAMGVQWLFAPDADVNNNPDNPIINTRSYGEDPSLVAEHVKAYIEGAAADPNTRVLTTVKHFPGHGNTDVDSHIGLASSAASREHLEAVELVPFRAAISAHVDAVMTAHMTVPAVEPEPIPATISPKVLTTLLRQELGFSGLIVTDAMDMGGLAKQIAPGEAAVRALLAGADVLLMPLKPEETIQAVLAAVQQGRLTRARLDSSALKVLQAKAHVGLNRRKLVDVEALSEAVDSPTEEARAQEVADRALTLVKNGGDALPLRHPETACLFALVEGRYSQQGRRLSEELKKRLPAMKTQWLEAGMSTSDLDAAAQSTTGCSQVLVATFVTVGAYRGDVALPPAYLPFMTKLLAGPAPVTMISFGNPYLLKSYPQVAAYLATFSTVPDSEVAVAKALAAAIPVSGHLPITIPGQAKIGDGLQLPARTGTATSETQR